MEKLSLAWSWGTGDDDLAGMLISIARHLGPVTLSVIMRQLAEDYRHSTSGMPDLILWREHGSPTLQLVEVKSAKDRLSDAQRYWFQVFQEHDIPMIVCRIGQH